MSTAFIGLEYGFMAVLPICSFHRSYASAGQMLSG